MPYKVKNKCIYKVNKDGTLGKRVGCTKGNVQKYLAALRINAESKGKIMKQTTEQKVREIIREEISNLKETEYPDNPQNKRNEELAIKFITSEVNSLDEIESVQIVDRNGKKTKFLGISSPRQLDALVRAIKKNWTNYGNNPGIPPNA